MPVDIESVVIKVHNFFHIYTVRTEKLKEFCETADLSHQELFKHSRTGYIFRIFSTAGKSHSHPAVEKILKIYPALKEYFLTQDKFPLLLKNFFFDDFSELYLWFIHSNMSLFHAKIASIERENNSIVEVITLIHSLKEALKNRVDEIFIPFKVQQLLLKLKNENNDEKIDNFREHTRKFYQRCLEHMDKWTSKLSQFDSFVWLDLKSIRQKNWRLQWNSNAFFY